MKRRTRHATRNLLRLLPRRRPVGGGAPWAARMLGALQLSSKSALSLMIGGLILIFIGLLIANFVGQVLQSGRLEAQRTTLEAEVAQIGTENARIQGSVEFTESDAYVERAAREQLGYAREGDIVILPRMAPTAAATPPENTTTTALPATPRIPNWYLWWGAFFPTET